MNSEYQKIYLENQQQTSKKVNIKQYERKTFFWENNLQFKICMKENEKICLIDNYKIGLPKIRKNAGKGLGKIRGRE